MSPRMAHSLREQEPRFTHAGVSRHGPGTAQIREICAPTGQRSADGGATVIGDLISYQNDGTGCA